MTSLALVGAALRFELLLDPQLTLWEAPDSASMAAAAIGISAGRAVISIHTMVLMSIEETLAAIKQAASIGYRSRPEFSSTAGPSRWWLPMPRCCLPSWGLRWS